MNYSQSLLLTSNKCQNVWIWDIVVNPCPFSKCSFVQLKTFIIYGEWQKRNVCYFSKKNDPSNYHPCHPWKNKNFRSCFSLVIPYIFIRYRRCLMLYALLYWSMPSFIEVSALGIFGKYSWQQGAMWAGGRSGMSCTGHHLILRAAWPEYLVLWCCAGCHNAWGSKSSVVLLTESVSSKSSTLL